MISKVRDRREPGYFRAIHIRYHQHLPYIVAQYHHKYYAQACKDFSPEDLDVDDHIRAFAAE